MKVKLITSILLLLAGSALAGTSTPVNIARNTYNTPLLGIPRYKGGLEGDVLMCVLGQFGTNQPGWVVSQDRGDSWIAAAARVDGDWYLSDHTAAWVADGLHIAFRQSGAAGYRYVAPPAESESDFEPVDIPATGTDTYYPIVVANGADDVWFFDMNEGSSRDNLRYWHTTDRFAGSPSVGYVCHIADDPQNTWRMGAVLNDVGNPVVSLLLYTSDGTRAFVVCNYDGVSWDSVTVFRHSSLSGVERSYCHTSMNMRNHIAFTFINGQSRDYLLHFHENASGEFERDTISDFASHSLDNQADPQFCIHGEGGSARLYVVYNRSGDEAVCAKSWTPADGWDADSVVISHSSHVCTGPQVPPHVPSSWDFIPIWYYASNTDSLYFVKLDAEMEVVPDTVAPAAIMDLGAVPEMSGSWPALSWKPPHRGTVTDVRVTGAVRQRNW